MFCYRTGKLLEEKAYYPQFALMQGIMLTVTLLEAGAVYYLVGVVSQQFGLLGAIGLGVVLVAVLPCIGVLVSSCYYNMMPMLQTFVKRFAK